jgi:hypothetical protein
VRLLRAVIEEASDGTLNEPRFKRVLQMQSDSIRRTVPDYAFGWLADVAMHKRLVIDDESPRSTVDLMLQNNVVMRYMNDEEWFDIHPAVREMPAVREAIERAR